MYIMGLYIPKKIKSVKDENNEYIQPLKIKFIETFESNINYNENITPFFYNKTQFNECIKNTNNELEQIWKIRILLEKTPRGNVLMYYNAYKMAFSFFCDQQITSYDILNAVAMKYVKIYRCRDFFMDESIKENISPLISIHFSEEKKPIQRQRQNSNNFVKLRDYKKYNPNSKKINTINEPEYKKNTFLYLGKINNFQLIQSLPKSRKILAKFTSPLLDSIEKESGIKREAFSYKQFKQVKETIQSD